MRAKARQNDPESANMQLEVNPDTVRFIAERMRVFQAKEGVTFPDSGDDDWAQQVLADHADDPVLIEIREAVEELAPDQQAELVALMWIGRGDFDAEEWETVRDQARQSWNERTADYLIGTPLVADFLEEGLDLIGFG